MTNIAELVEYVLLPHNDGVSKPRALNTCQHGIAEIGVDKGLIKNKKILSDLIEKEKGYGNEENTSENESNEESSLDREEEGKETVSANDSEAEDSQESENDTENVSAETENNNSEKTTIFHYKNPCDHCVNSNVYGSLTMKRPRLLQDLSHMRSPDPRGEII